MEDIHKQIQLLQTGGPRLRQILLWVMSASSCGKSAPLLESYHSAPVLCGVDYQAASEV